MPMSPTLLIPRGSGGIRSPLTLRPDLYLRPDEGVFSSGSRTLTASDKTSFVGTERNTTRVAGVSFWFEAWVKVAAGVSAGTIYDDGALGLNGVYWDVNAGGKTAIYMQSTDVVEVNATSVSNVPADVWTHILITAQRTLGSLKIYINGVLDSTSDISAVNNKSVVGLLFPCVGAYGYGDGVRSYGGSLAHVRYGEVLNAANLPSAADIAWLSSSPRTYADIDARGGNLITSLTSTASITGFNYECNETDPTSGLIDQAGTLDLVLTPTNFVTNGTFAANINDWTNHATYGWDVAHEWDAGGKLHLQSSGDGAPAYGLTSTPCTALTAGKTYRIKYDLVCTAGAINCLVVDVPVGDAKGYADYNRSASASIDTTFVAVAGAAVIEIFSVNNLAANWLIDNVSLTVAGVAVGDGPAECVAKDSVGDDDGTLMGFSAAQLISAWTTDIATALGDGGYALTLDGTDDYVSCGNVGNVTNLDFYVKFLVDNQEICTLAGSTATAITVAAGTLTFGAGLTMSAVTIDGTVYTADLAAAGALLNDNAWHHVVLTITSIAASDFRIGTDSAAFGNIVVDEFKLGTAHTWKFDDGPMGTPTTGDFLHTWETLEGTRYQFQQTTAANRPTENLVAINSLPAVDFDGTTDYQRVASVVALSVANPTVAIVMQCDDPTTAAVQVLLACQDEGSVNNFLYFGIATDGKFVVAGNDAATTFSVTGDTVLDTDAHLLEATWDGSNWHLKIDGVAETETRAGTECAPADIAGMDSTSVGASLINNTAAQWFAGFIADIVVKSNLTAGQLLALERYADKRYAL